jgi:hypothetical protein
LAAACTRTRARQPGGERGPEGRIEQQLGACVPDLDHLARPRRDAALGGRARGLLLRPFGIRHLRPFAAAHPERHPGRIPGVDAAGSPPAPIGGASASGPAKIAKYRPPFSDNRRAPSGAVAFFMALRPVSQPGPRRDRSQAGPSLGEGAGAQSLFSRFFRSTSNPCPINQRMASEREGLSRSMLRQ